MNALPAISIFGSSGQTVQEALTQNQQQSEVFKDLVKRFNFYEKEMSTMSPDLLKEYFAITDQKGEIAAMQWMITQQAKSTNH